MPKHAAGDVTIGFCEETSEMLRMCCLWNLNVWFASFRLFILNLFSRCHRWKPSSCAWDCLRGEKKPLIKSIRDIFYVLIKLLHVRRSANFTTMLQFYSVIRAGPPFPSLLVTSGGLFHMCWVYFICYSGNEPIERVVFREEPLQKERWKFIGQAAHIPYKMVLQFSSLLLITAADLPLATRENSIGNQITDWLWVAVCGSVCLNPRQSLLGVQKSLWCHSALCSSWQECVQLWLPAAVSSLTAWSSFPLASQLKHGYRYGPSHWYSLDNDNQSVSLYSLVNGSRIK